MKIAVVLVNFNGLNDTKECIESVNAAKNDLNVDIYVVDNASNDNEAEIIKQQFSDVKVFRSESNLGFAGGNNIAVMEILKSDYDTVVLLNNDTVIEKDFFEAMCHEHEKNTILAPKMLYYSDPDMIWYGGGEINKKTGNSVHFNMDQPDVADNTVMTCSFATGCCMWIPVSVIKKIGLMDESYFMYCEDSEYCLRAKKNNVKIVYNPSARIYHKISRSTGGSDSPFSNYYLTRNRIRYISDYKEYFNFTAYAFTIISRLFRAVQYKIRGKKGCRAFLKGIVDGVRNEKGKIL